MKDIKRDLAVLKRKLLAKHLWFARFMLVALAILLLWGVVAGARSFISRTTAGEYMRMAGSFLFTPRGTIEDYEGRVNILLLGLSGDGVKNPVLSDTMILLSVNTKSPKGMNMISVPRDIWVPEMHDKINSAYLHGNEKRAGGGLILSESAIEEVLGVPIQYSMAIDFEGFIGVIDILGGIEVDVERSFTDTKFPISGREDDDCGGGDEEYLCRYETISFEKGRQMMNGETALKFSRSRHSPDPEEGNDLARAARQQKVLFAIKDKILATPVTSLGKFVALWNKFQEITETSLTSEQLAYLGRLLYDARGNISSVTIPEELLYNPPYSKEYDNLYVFVPKAGDWREVHSWVAGVLAGGE